MNRWSDYSWKHSTFECKDPAQSAVKTSALLFSRPIVQYIAEKARQVAEQAVREHVEKKNTIESMRDAMVRAPAQLDVSAEACVYLLIFF